MYDEEWMVRAGAWAGLGALLAIGSLCIIVAGIIIFIRKLIGG